MNVPTAFFIGLIVILIVMAVSLAMAWPVIRRLERELRDEAKERRELGYALQKHQWEANRCYDEALGLRRQPPRDAEWVKASSPGKVTEAA